MYENQNRDYKNIVRHRHFCRGPPDIRDMVHISHSPNRDGLCPLTEIISPQSTKTHNQMIRKLKFIIPLIALCLLLGTGRANAQWTVIDPSNIAQSIVNSSKSLVQESQTATHMVKNCAPV